MKNFHIYVYANISSLDFRCLFSL